MNIKNRTTLQFYKELQLVYDRFNERLFKNELPDCLITLQRINKNTGYWSENRFASTEDDTAYTHELALNPDYFGTQPLLNIFKCYAHEMCHMKQSIFGEPSKRSYHNAEFATFMLEIGLIMTDDGTKEGRTTGEKMTEIVVPDGLFIQVCNELVDEGRIIKWYDKYAPKTISSLEMIQEQVQLLESIPTASPKLFHIALLGNEINSALKSPKKEKPVAEPSKAPDTLTGYAIPTSDEEEEPTPTTMNPFDVAIGLIDISNTAANLGGYYPTAFDEDPLDDDDQPIPEPKVVKLYKGEQPNGDDNEFFVLKETMIGETLYQELGLANFEEPEPKPKKQTRASFACPECGRGATCSPTFRLSCTECEVELVPSKSIDKSQVKKNKKAAKADQGDAE